jgi:hypothetical protein
MEVNNHQRDQLSAVDTQLSIHAESPGKSMGIHQQEKVKRASLYARLKRGSLRRRWPVACLLLPDERGASRDETTSK